MQAIRQCFSSYHGWNTLINRHTKCANPFSISMETLDWGVYKGLPMPFPKNHCGWDYGGKQGTEPWKHAISVFVPAFEPILHFHGVNPGLASLVVHKWSLQEKFKQHQYAWPLNLLDISNQDNRSLHQFLSVGQHMAVLLWLFLLLREWKIKGRKGQKLKK